MNAQSFKERKEEIEKTLSGLSLNQISEIDKQVFITKNAIGQIEEMIGGSMKTTNVTNFIASKTTVSVPTVNRWLMSPLKSKERAKEKKDGKKESSRKFDAGDKEAIRSIVQKFHEQRKHPILPDLIAQFKRVRIFSLSLSSTFSLSTEERKRVALSSYRSLLNEEIFLSLSLSSSLFHFLILISLSLSLSLSLSISLSLCRKGGKAILNGMLQRDVSLDF